MITLKTFKATLFIHLTCDNKPIVTTQDMQQHGWPLMGTHIVDVPIPEFNLEEVKIKCLNLKSDGIKETYLKDISSVNKQIELLKEKNRHLIKGGETNGK
jgi:hypothetical protein